MRTPTFLFLSAFAKAGVVAGLAARAAATAGALLFPFAAAANPATLKLSFFTSDQSATYVSCVKPFVDAVNLDGAGSLHIEVYLSGTLGKTQKEIPELVRSGVADIAFVVPGQTPELFPDTEAMELPGLFRDAREATLVYTRLIAAGSVTDFKDFVVMRPWRGALVDPEPQAAGVPRRPQGSKDPLEQCDHVRRAGKTRRHASGRCLQ
jgi:hypothetical protein